MKNMKLKSRKHKTLQDEESLSLKTYMLEQEAADTKGGLESTCEVVLTLDNPINSELEIDRCASKYITKKDYRQLYHAIRTAEDFRTAKEVLESVRSKRDVYKVRKLVERFLEY